MSREIITREGLAAYMTDELRKIEGCENCSIGQVNILQHPDEDGCNWSDNLTINITGCSLNDIRSSIDKIMANARSRFNILE